MTAPDALRAALAEALHDETCDAAGVCPRREEHVAEFTGHYGMADAILAHPAVLAALDRMRKDAAYNPSLDEALNMGDGSYRP